MANLSEQPTWEPGIYQLEETDVVQGGPDGIDNVQAKAFANRTTYLKAEVEQRAPIANPQFTGVPQAPTPAAGTDSDQLATTAFVAQALAALLNAPPAALDTLNELAAALGDDPNFAATVMSLLAAKAPLASPALTGTPTAPTQAQGDSSTALATTAFVKSVMRAFSVQVFTTSGTFSTPAEATKLGVLIVGGGGSGGGGNSGGAGSGGGAGGFCFGLVDAPAGDYSVTVGAKGIGVAQGQGTSGGTSSFGALFSATGGGAGGGPGGGNGGSSGHGAGGLLNAFGGGGQRNFDPGEAGCGGGSLFGSGGVRSGGSASPYGAGGAGHDAGAVGTGGNGADGVVIVIW